MNNCQNDFAHGYNYARRRYRELAASCGRQTMLELAATLGKATGGEAELARGIAAGIEDMAQAEKEGAIRPELRSPPWLGLG